MSEYLETDWIIEALRADGEPKLLLIAADRLEELQRERDEARAEVERLKDSLNGAMQQTQKLIKERNDLMTHHTNTSGKPPDMPFITVPFPAWSVPATLLTRPEPSRLEIAAMTFTAWQSNPFVTQHQVEAKQDYWTEQYAIETADALIAAAKEEK